MNLSRHEWWVSFGAESNRLWGKGAGDTVTGG